MPHSSLVRWCGLLLRMSLCSVVNLSVCLCLFNSWPIFSPYLYNRVLSEVTSRNSLSHSRLACSCLSGHTRPPTPTSPRLESGDLQAWNEHALLLTDESVNKVQLQRSWIKLVRPLSTVENTRFARVFHNRQWSNYNLLVTTASRGKTSEPIDN